MVVDICGLVKKGMKGWRLNEQAEVDQRDR